MFSPCEPNILSESLQRAMFCVTPCIKAICLFRQMLHFFYFVRQVPCHMRVQLSTCWMWYQRTVAPITEFMPFKPFNSNPSNPGFFWVFQCVIVYTETIAFGWYFFKKFTNIFTSFSLCQTFLNPHSLNRKQKYF